ncbi:hypothetical protein MKX01_006625 [Papaver californicum]|nr:hypothetical protein MKX01_006625 [Papaver californicum]
MEGKNLKMISVMVVLILGMLAGKSTADVDYKQCYNFCMELCSAAPQAAICPFTCWRDCTFQGKASLDDEKVTGGSAYNYCKLGCAAMDCINKNTPQDLSGQEMKDCYNFHCGKECTK